MGKIVIAGFVASFLVACTPPSETVAPSFISTPIYSAQSIGPIEGGVEALAFAPNASIPWQGRILIAPRTGGLVAYDIEGKLSAQVDGPTYTALAIHPGFSLRKLKTSLVLAVTVEGSIAPMIIDDARGQIFAAPVSGLDFSNAEAVCTLPSLPGQPKFAISRRDGTFELWQIEDTGEDNLQAQKLRAGILTVPVHSCSSANAKIYAIGTNGGIFTIDSSRDPVIETAVNSAQSNLIAIALNENETYLLTTDGKATILSQFNQKLVKTATLSAVASLSIPAVEQPGVLAMTTWSYGGAGFSAGLIAITDHRNNLVSLVVRDTLPGFPHDQETR